MGKRHRRIVDVWEAEYERARLDVSIIVHRCGIARAIEIARLPTKHDPSGGYVACIEEFLRQPYEWLFLLDSELVRQKAPKELLNGRRK